MPLIAKQTGQDLPPIRPGAYTAACILVADVGMSQGGRYQPQQKVFIQWELIGQWVKIQRDGKTVELPRLIGKFYTLSLSRKARLRGDLESWRGRLFTEAELKGFDLFTILGAPCQLGIVHDQGADGKTYTNVATIMGLAQGTKKPVPESTLLRYARDEPRDFDRLPPWLQDRIRQGEAAMPAPAETDAAPSDPDAPEFDDDIPF
jgi:hypothetical protein